MARDFEGYANKVPEVTLGLQKDGKRFAGTGGWGFEGFAAGDPARPVVQPMPKSLAQF